MNPSYVPTRLIQPLVIEWVERRSHSVDSYIVNGQRCVSPRNILAELSGVSSRTIQAIVNSERAHVEFHIAEKLLVRGMDDPHAFHEGELGQWYSRRLRFSERELVA